MAVKQLSGEWNKKDTVKSILFFLLHTIILIVLLAAVLLADKLTYIKEYMNENNADYLYALFAVVMLLLIMYFYFLFEDK